MAEEKKQNTEKSFKLTNIALKNSTSVFILIFLITFAGWFSYVTTPKELFPDIKIPTIYVSTSYPGNSPIDMENLITRPLEKEIHPIKGIKELSSTSIQDFSAIIVEFNTNVDVNKALRDVKDAVDIAKSELPTDLPNDPSVVEIDFSEFPIFNINLSGDYSVDDLKGFAEDLQDDIENVSEISKAEIKGAFEREIHVKVDVHKMELNEVSFNDIEGAIANENTTISGGDIITGDNRRTVRVDGEFKTVREIEDVIVKHESGNIVFLRDIAEIVDGYKDRNSYARLNDDPVVSIDVIKKGGENLLEATDKIMAIIEDAQKKYLPENLEVTITNDQSEQTRSQIQNLENSVISGVILVVLVLLFFLGVRNALFVGMAIPMSMLLSFIVLGFMGVSMNLVVLFSLILALGMLVDNAIVGIENIYRLYQEGASAYQATKQGIGEIAIPIIASTATTLAAFFPLMLWDGMIGEFMGYLPLTLIIVLTSSLFVALVINPVVAKTFLTREDEYKINIKRIRWYIIAFIVIGALGYLGGSSSIGNLSMFALIITLLNSFLFKRIAKWFQYTFLPWVESIYVVTLKKSLSGFWPGISLVMMFFLMIGSMSFYFMSEPKVNFFPVNQPKYINVFVEAPISSDIEYTNKVTVEIEKDIKRILEPYQHIVRSVVTNVGTGTADPNEGPSMGDTPNKARINISFFEYEERQGVNTSEVMKKISTELVEIPGVLVTVDKNNEGPPVGKPINLELVGEDLSELIAFSEQVSTAIENSPIQGIEELKSDMELGKPELLLNIDRSRARSYGLSTAQIGSTIRTALFGNEVSKFKDGEDDYPIILRLKEDYRYNFDDLINQRVTFRDAGSGRIVQVPISAVTDYTYQSTYGSVKRKDMKRVITLSSNVIEGYNATNINNQLKQLMSKMDIPDGFEYKFTGEQAEQEDSADFLVSALLIAVSLITLILVSQFNSIVKPVIIVLSVLFSTIGVFLGLAIFKMDFVVVMTGIGIVSLAGIVVNNAIVLIDYIDLVKKRKRSELGLEEEALLPREEAREAIVEGGKVRLRPVLLTAITTVLGLVPLATGMNIDFYGLVESLNPNIYFGGDNALFWGPMAWTVIFGLTFATFLTLIIVPVMYLLSDRLVRFTRKLVGSQSV